MPEGPNKAEEMLQRYAKERRERGGDFSPHPATRKMLQGEVARQFAKTGAREDRPAWLAWFGLWRGRIAVGAALASVLIGGLWFFAGGAYAPKQIAGVSEDRLARRIAGREMIMDRTDPSLVLAKAAKAEPLADLQEFVFEEVTAKQTVIEDLALVDRAEPAVHYDYFFSAAPGAANTTDYGMAAGNTVSLSPVPNSWQYPNAASANSWRGTFSNVAAARSERGLPLIAQQSRSAGAARALAYDFGQATNSATVADTTEIPFGPVALLALRDPVAQPKRGEKLAELTGNTAERPGVAESVSGDLKAVPNNSSVAGVAAPAVSAGTALSVAPQEQAVTVAGREAAGVGGHALAASSIATRYFRFDAAGAAGVRFYGDRTQSRARLADGVAKNSPAGAPAQAGVLEDFVVEQRTNAIRLIDADGSVYDGFIENPIAAKPESDSDALPKDKEFFGREAGSEVKKERDQLGIDGGSTFRASGSNVTLRQLVVVNGRIVSSTNTIQSDLFGAIRATDSPVLAPAATAPAPAQRQALKELENIQGQSRTNGSMIIEGTIRLGGTNEQRFRALSEARQ
jgi:hypothetical protein